MHGFCILYVGFANEIQLGWYHYNETWGNWMQVEAKTMRVINQGWYEHGIRLSDMKDDDECK